MKTRQQEETLHTLVKLNFFELTSVCFDPIQINGGWCFCHLWLLNVERLYLVFFYKKWTVQNVTFIR